MMKKDENIKLLTVVEYYIIMKPGLQITDKEELTPVEVIKQFRLYLANAIFTMYTDNISMKRLKQIKNCQG